MATMDAGFGPPATYARFYWTSAKPGVETGRNSGGAHRGGAAGEPRDRGLCRHVVVEAAGGSPSFSRRRAAARCFRRDVAAAVDEAARARRSDRGVGDARARRACRGGRKRGGVPLVRVEDGFLRSIGLGSDFLPGVSIVLDEGGIYSIPTAGSDLERLLRDGDFDEALLARAHRLVDRIVASGITKYNLAGSCMRIAMAAGQAAHPGARPGRGRSVGAAGRRCGALAISICWRGCAPPTPTPLSSTSRTPMSLPATARAPSAPRRCASMPIGSCVRGSIAALCGEIDELHMLTSLSGFEALLRRVPVTVDGRPFYAGLGAHP